MYCRYCGKEVKEKAIVCTGCGRPVDEPGSLTSQASSAWTFGTLLALMLASLFFPPLGLFVGIKGFFSESTKIKATVLLTVSVFAALFWAAIILGL